MTPPKEKAKELIDKYWDSQISIFELNNKQYAMDCALIAVDVILNEWDNFTYRDIARKDYWTLVKLSIQEA